MDIWTKYPEEVLLVGRDWSLDLDGSTISGTPATPSVPIGYDIEMEYVETEGDVTKYWLRGGISGRTCIVDLEISTSEGETLGARVEIKVCR